MLDFLQSENISREVIQGISAFRQQFPLEAADQERLGQPRYHYYGKEVWEQAATALLCGQNLLLVGAKSTGKNVLAENLAAAFGRPLWNVSFHINMDASLMVGTDTFQDGQVTFRPGPVYQCAKLGGFGVLDEINMARNEALAVLHSLLDYRRLLDVPGYDVVKLHGATRFIATMNYGYAGTRELNEALASRFAVLKLPVISAAHLQKLLQGEFPALLPQAVQLFTDVFFDLHKKCAAGEISDKAVDLRGLLDALHLMEKGLAPQLALAMGLTNKAFDEYEAALVSDVLAARLPQNLERRELFAQ